MSGDMWDGILEKKKELSCWKLYIVGAFFMGLAYADTDLPTKFSNHGGVINTRHNLSQSTIGGGAAKMNPFRNDYGEVCVYCHTPHASNQRLDAPLWNRTAAVTSYITYEALGTSSLTQQISGPGINSQTCLSCHDGTLAIDSIVNMPGAGNFSSVQQLSQNDAFLNTWDNPRGADATQHTGLNDINPTDGCLACHSTEAGAQGNNATAFNIFAIGRDLTNDHPIGINYPLAGSAVDFNPPTNTKGNIAFFDTDGDDIVDTNEVRIYDTGEGFKVECASCHDPHGVPSSGQGSTLFPSFLRASNEESAACLTCHVK